MRFLPVNLLATMLLMTHNSNGHVHLTVLRVFSCRMAEIVSKVILWITENKLRLKDGKMEAMLVTSGHAAIADSVPTLLHVGLSDIKFKSQVKNFGITIDCYHTLHQHVTNVCASAYIGLCCIVSIPEYLSFDATKMLLSAFVLYKLDYCNFLLATPPNSDSQREIGDE